MITIAWDIDDVLNDLMRCWFRDQWLPAHLGSKIRFEEITENPPERVLGCTKDDYLCSLDDFRASEAFWEMSPDPAIMAWFETSGDQARHIALTAVPQALAHRSASWVLKHFGKWIRSFHFVPSPRSGEKIPAYDRSKADFLTWFGKADVLVDDSEQNIREAAKAGVQGFLVAQPWNHGLKTQDVLKKLNELIKGTSKS
jgi:hypothetical protein